MRICTFEVALKQLTSYPRKPVRPTPWNCNLDIGNLEVKISCFKKVCSLYIKVIAIFCGNRFAVIFFFFRLRQKHPGKQRPKPQNLLTQMNLALAQPHCEKVEIIKLLTWFEIQ